MYQIKLVQGKDIETLNNDVNLFLASLSSEAVKSIEVNLDSMPTALIQYEVKDVWVDRKCYDCKYWDDGGDSASVSGMCVEHGQRRRFSCKACKSFKDIREVSK